MSNDVYHTQSPLDQVEVAQFISRLVRAGETNKSIARAVTQGFGLETTDDSIRRFRKRHQLQIPGTEPSYLRIKDDEVDAQSEAKTGPILTDPDAMLLERGLDPADWYVDDVGVNKWDAPVAGGNKVKMHQTKFHAKRKQPYVGLMPPRTDGRKHRERIVLRPGHGQEWGMHPQLVVICGDQQAPFHDTKLHSAFCEWLEYNEPDRGVVLGDLGDYNDISRHPRDPENLAQAQECLQASYDILDDYVNSSPDTPWDYLIGNHDERIRQYMLKNAPGLFPLRTVDNGISPGEEIHGMSHLMRLDELGVNLVEPHGSYEWAQVDLSKNLAVRHGWIAQQGSGKSALITLNQTGYSIIVGHTHRQSIVHKSQPEIDGNQRTTLAVEAGCMCRIDPRGFFDEKGRRFPNYGAGHADWQRGFCTAVLYPDGRFKVDLATYVNETLLWRNQRYE